MGGKRKKTPINWGEGEGEVEACSTELGTNLLITFTQSTELNEVHPETGNKKYENELLRSMFRKWVKRKAMPYSLAWQQQETENHFASFYSQAPFKLLSEC